MALQWNVTKNKNAYREVSKDEYVNHIKENTHKIMQVPTYEENDRYYIMNVQCYQLIWLCGITIGITDITEMNYERVYNRIAIYENIFGATLQSKNPLTNTIDSFPYTLEIVKANIGIETNGVFLTKSKWKSNLISQIVGKANI
jgi:hypothetical protein